MLSMVRTDLADEARDLLRQQAGDLLGVVSRHRSREGFPVVEVTVESAEAAKALGKEQGRYVTLDLTALARREEDSFPRAVQAVAEELRSLLPPLSPTDGVLVAGLGNRAMTPDAVGPLAVDHTLVTRHLVQQLPEQFGSLRPVAALAAGVLGTTGVESGTLVRAVTGAVSPRCVVAVDALCARAVERLCTTVQLSDTGISPGSGVGNRRAALDEASLGVPVVVVGVPTVIHAATVAAEVLEQEGHDPEEKTLGGGHNDLVATPKDIDARVAHMAKVVGYGITLALQPSLRLEDVEMLLS